MILDALKYLSVKHPVSVIVKLHPLEGPERLHSVIGECDNDDIRVLKRYPPRRLIAAADVVTGMTSVFLLETALMGRPAISLQPGRLLPDSFVESQREFIKLALTDSECRIHLAAALSESEATWQQRRKKALARGFDGLASQRIASLIYKELGLSAREVGIANSG
jgi:hypothetical protein